MSCSAAEVGVVTVAKAKAMDNRFYGVDQAGVVVVAVMMAESKVREMAVAAAAEFEEDTDLRYHAQICMRQ
jgi:hypothetical protein